jgi:hypothetical protein
MHEIHAAAVDQLVADDLIRFFTAILDARYLRGVRYPKWFLLLAAVLAS